MHVGVNDAAIAPPVLMRTTQALALAGGADSFWVPDHLINIVPASIWNARHTRTAWLAPRADAFLEPWTALGFMAGKTRFSRLGLGVGVTDTGRRNPAVTAQAAATLHLVSRGRAILGIGTGERESNVPYGVAWDKPVGRFEESLATIRALWDSKGALVNRDSEFFPLRDAVFDVPPFRGRRPEIWVAAHGPRMLRATGRYADAWFPAWPQSPADYAGRLAAVRTAASDAGRDPAKIKGAGWYMTFTAPTKGMVEHVLGTVGARLVALIASAEVWRRHGVEHPMGPEFTGLQDLLPQVVDAASAERYADMVPEALLRDIALCGTPNEIAEQLAEYGRAGLSAAVLTHGSLYFSLEVGSAAVPSFVQVLRKAKRL